MTTPAEVVTAAGEMLSGSRVERARAGVRAFGLFNELDTADKRDLAVLVAQRAAPELVPRIQAEGGVDLTEDQSKAVLDMVRRLDGDDLRELQDAVSSGDARRRAMSSVGTAAATATGLDDVVGEAGASTAAGSGEPVLDEAAERATFRLEALERQSDTLREELADEEAARREADNARQHAERELADLRQELAEETERADDTARKLDQAHTQARLAEDRLRASRARSAGSGATTPASPHTGSPHAATPTPGGPVVPVSTTGDEVDALVARLGAVRPSEALRVLTLAAPSVAGMDADGRRRMVEALPDGWVRQRGLQRLVEAEAVPAAEAPDLLALLEATGTQVFAASSMLATGLVHADDLVDVLDPTALARLRRRPTS